MARDESPSADVKPQPAKAFPWAVAAPFIDSVSSRWISDFIESPRHGFIMVPHGAQETSWHTKKASRTGVGEWLQFNQTSKALIEAAAASQGGAITVFPQLAASTAWAKRRRRLDVPLVAWFFNTTFGRDIRSVAARTALAAVDQFVVHSTVEIAAYADHLHLPHDRFSFAHVQYGGDVQSDPIDTDEPFVFATGSGFRDYRTLFEAVGKLGFPTKIAAGPRVLAGLTPPPNVEILDGVTRTDIHHLVRRATVNVLPMKGDGLTAGLITMAEAFRHQRGLVVSDRPGIDDYVTHDQNALLVPMADSSAMADAIEAVMVDSDLRDRLNSGAAACGELRHTDVAAAEQLQLVLDRLI